jgi:hypothetical protein
MAQARAEQADAKVARRRAAAASIQGVGLMTTTTIWRARCARCKSERRCTDVSGYEDALPVCDGCGYRVESGWQRWEVSETRGTEWSHGEPPITLVTRRMRRVASG